MATRKGDVRIERDGLGDMAVPAAAYWGIRTQRNRELYSVSGQRPHARLIDAIVIVKKAAAQTNAEMGRLEPSQARAISQACDEILNGQWRDQFVADILQSGAGVSVIDNVNEVLANRGAELLGAALGSYDRLHPQAHVNLGQSANDVFPTAMRLSILLVLKEFQPILLDLERLLRRKSLEFEKVVKVGRTHLQDSMPITLGQEFNAYGSSVERSERRIKEASNSLLEANLGTTAVGTGYGAEPAYTSRVIEKLSQLTGFKFRPAEDLFRATQSMADFMEFSSSLKELAIELTKMTNDLRLLASGPRAGFHEIDIPIMQLELPEASPQIQTRQSTPFLAESLNMVCYQVLGNDTVVSLCAQAGQLESNVMTPLLIYSILSSMDLLKNALVVFNQRCLAGITANKAGCQESFERSTAIDSLLCGFLGTELIRELTKQSEKSGKSLKQLILEQKLMPPEILDKVLHYKSLTRPGSLPIGMSRITSGSSSSPPIDDG